MSKLPAPFGGPAADDLAGRFARIDTLLEKIGDPTIPAELARLGNLEDQIGGGNAINDGEIGGGGGETRGPPGLDVSIGSDSEAEEEKDQVWKPGLPATPAYNPGLEQAGGFTPPSRQQPDTTIPGAARMPGRAGAGIKGQDGRTSQDDDYRTDRGYSDDDPVHVASRDGENHGRVTRETGTTGSGWHRQTRYYEDGTRENIVWQASQDGSGSKEVSRTHYTDGSVRVEVRISEGEDERPADVQYYWPDSQPNPDPNAPGKTANCGSGRWDFWTGCVGGSAPTKQKVSQPGRGDDQADARPFSPTVAERKNVVTNPVDPDLYRRTGGGGSRRPMEWVTGPPSR